VPAKAFEGTLELQVTDSTDPLSVGDETEYRISLVNRGLQTARQVRVEADVPANLRVVSAKVFQAEQQLDVGLNVQGQRIAFAPVANLAPDTRLDFVIQAKALRPGDGALRAQVTHETLRRPVEVRETTTVNPRRN